MTSATSNLSPGAVERWGSYLDAPLQTESSWTILALALAAGVAFDQGLRSGIDTVGGALATLVVSVALLASGRVRNPQARALIAAAPMFGVWLAVRTSPWLIPFDILAVLALLFLGSSLSSGGSVFDVSIPRAVARAVQAVLNALFVPAFLVRGAAGRQETSMRRVIRAVAIALPLVVLLGALFASADAIFAKAVDFDITKVVQHVVAIAVGTLGAGWLLRLASLQRAEVPDVAAPTLSPLEWTIILGALDGVLAGFAVAQIVAVSGGAKHVLDTAGLTYAEYARSGFFQLLAAVAITGASLTALHAAAGAARGNVRFRALSLAAIALTVVVALSAFRRLTLYEHVFGMTMLRLYVHVAIIGAIVLLALLALRLAGVAGSRPWFAPVAGIVILATLFGLNVANPESVVASYNRTHASVRFDSVYLADLSSDAAPALSGDPALCRLAAKKRPGWAAFNVGRYRAQSLRKEHCR